MSTSDLPPVSRRGFLRSSMIAGAVPGVAEAAMAPVPAEPLEAPVAAPEAARSVAPEANWIWYPEGRTLPATFMFFRRTLQLRDVPTRAAAWVTASTRYILYVNGKYVQRGPAPCDPRMMDIDPADLRPFLKAGENVIGVLVCHFGHGDGTSVPIENPAGPAGLLFQAEIESGGQTMQVVSDTSWKVDRARCWPGGKYQRWFLRAVQEDFDARKYPYGWNEAGFDDSSWRTPKVKKDRPGLPIVIDHAREGFPREWQLVPRSIPPMLEVPVKAPKLASRGRIRWNMPPEEYFDYFPSDAFTEEVDEAVASPAAGGSVFPVKVQTSLEFTTAVTFEFDEEIAGHIFVRLRAPAGTVCELLYVEAQEPNALMLRGSAHHATWMRVTAREGETWFESFDYDALRWLQLLIRNANGPVEILEAGVNRRLYPYAKKPDLRTSSEVLNRVFTGSVNSHLISCQDTMMDNVTRERQQYAGDVDHAKLASYYAFGEYRQPRRMLETFAMGQGPDGWFLDCYPGWDRCTRLWQKYLGITEWGPLIDHGMGFIMSIATYQRFSGDRKTVEELYPKVRRFDGWLSKQVGADGLLPVSGYSWNDVWMDHFGWKVQADKAAALNIYYVGYLREGVAPLAELMNEPAVAAEARRRADQMAALTRRMFWSPQHRLVVDNLPRVAKDGELRLHDRTSAMAVLYGIIPAGAETETLDLLAGLPTRESLPEYPLVKHKGMIGFSFTANTCWRYWALSRFGRASAVVRDLQERWGSMTSLALNKTFSEWWNPSYSSKGHIWAQNTQVPIFLLYGHVLGITPTQAGFREFDVRPQPAPLEFVEGTAWAPAGGIHLRCERREDGLDLVLDVPAGLRPSLVLPANLAPQALSEARAEAYEVAGFRRWRLARGEGARQWRIKVGRA